MIVKIQQFYEDRIRESVRTSIKFVLSVHSVKKKTKQNKKKKQKSSFDRQGANTYPLWLSTVLEALRRLSGTRKLHKSMN